MSQANDKVVVKKTTKVMPVVSRISMWFGVAVITLLFSSVLVFAASTAKETQQQKSNITPSGDYIVQADDTLYSIAWRFGLDYRDIIALNHLPKPYALYVGEHIKLVQSSGSAPASLGNPPIVVKHLPKKNVSKSTTTSSNNQKTALKSASNTQVKPNKTGWIWPTKGKIMKDFDPQALSKGIDIAGKLAQPIVASSSGQVVYAGSGIPSYGNLIIVKNNSHYLSAYAYNQKNFVKEGQYVRVGQRIAAMGRNSAGKPVLHFEIRRNGKTVDPKMYLPSP